MYVQNIKPNNEKRTFPRHWKHLWNTSTLNNDLYIMYVNNVTKPSTNEKIQVKVNSNFINKHVNGGDSKSDYAQTIRMIIKATIVRCKKLHKL